MKVVVGGFELGSRCGFFCVCIGVRELMGFVFFSVGYLEDWDFVIMSGCGVVECSLDIYYVEYGVLKFW